MTAVSFQRKKFFKAVQLMVDIGYENVSHRLFDGMRHEILNEKDNITVYKDIAKLFIHGLTDYNY